MKHLRSYQREAIADLASRWDAGGTRIPQVLATGLGKTEIFTALESEWLDSLAAKYSLGKRVLVIVHTDELTEQAARKARQRNPHMTVGIVKAGSNEVHAQIVIASRQTLQSEKRRAQIKNVGLVIVDEAHHALRSNTYGKILEHFGAWNELCAECVEANEQVSGDVGYPVAGNYCPNPGCATMRAVKVAGYTATLARGDKEKLSTVWEKCTFSRDILFGIRRGYLLDVTGRRVVVPDLNMGNIRTTRGDFRDDDIAEELERTFAPEIIASHYAEAARTPDGALRTGIAFWPLVATAYRGAEAFERAGIPSAVVHGGLPREERRLILKRFHAGDIAVVHNCMVLTEGFDEPRADVVVVARPTKSPSLYQQCVGRVLRPDLTVPAEQRGKALILDVVGAGQAHDLCTLIDLSPERRLQRDDSLEELSLLQLDDMAQTAAEFPDPTWVAPHDGPTEVVAFDPLHRERAWQQTPGGTFFMSAGGDAYVFLAESWSGDPGTYDVVWAAKDVRGGQALTQHQGLPLDEALLCAEDEAIARGGVGTKTLTSRKSAWRKAEPTDAQLRLAARYGIVVPPGFTKGALSEALDLTIAGRRIDPLVRRVMANR